MGFERICKKIKKIFSLLNNKIKIKTLLLYNQNFIVYEKVSKG